MSYYRWAGIACVALFGKLLVLICLLSSVCSLLVLLLLLLLVVLLVFLLVVVHRLRGGVRRAGEARRARLAGPRGAARRRALRGLNNNKT